METLHQILQNSTSSDGNIRKEAESKLFEIPILTLLNASFSKIDVSLSLICLSSIKSRIDKSDESIKAQVALLIIQNLNQSNQPFSRQLAIILSKITRSEYPIRIPSLFDHFSSSIQQVLAENPISVNSLNAISTLHQIIKMLASKSLPISKRQFSVVCSCLF